MDVTIIWIAILKLLTFLPLSVAVPGLRTKDSIRGIVGAKVTLECKFSGHQQWFAVMWEKVTSSNDVVTIATLSPYDDPIYSSDFDTDIKRRLLSDYTFGSDSVDFNLDIHHVQCSDGATYRCTAVTSTGMYQSLTKLRVTEHPTKPNINYGVILVVAMNQSKSLDCVGKTDANSGTLQWYFKLWNTDAFRLVENSGHVTVIERDGCSKTLRRAVNITMIPELNNVVYRCALKDYYRSIDNINSFYDDVIIKSPEYPSISTPPTTREQMAIFPVSYIAADGSKSSASTVSEMRKLYFVTSLLFIIRK